MAALSGAVRLFVVAALALFVATAPASSAGRVPDPQGLVLRRSDLPWGYTLQQSYYADNARAAKELGGAPVADYVRWGRVSGYEARFTRDTFNGILDLRSSASTYKTVKGAAASTRAAYAAVGKTQRRWMGRRLVFKRVSIGTKIGHEARVLLASATEEGEGWREDRTWKFYLVIWRFGAVTATLMASGSVARSDEMASGYDYPIDAAEVVRLARKQQARIAAALA